MKTLSELGENELINRIIGIIGYHGNDIINGPDDAIGIPPPPSPNHVLVINTDMLVDTTDVPRQMNLYRAGRKAVVNAVSDLFVKGVIPKWASVSLGLPPHLPLNGQISFDELINGLADGFADFSISYLGGDLNETKEVVVDVTVMGYILPDKIIKRSGARPGDLIYTTGKYGNTGLGLKVLLDPNFEVPSALYDYKEEILNAVLAPSVDTETGPSLSEYNWASASADSSDGFLRTLMEIVEASKVGLEIYWGCIPKTREIQIYYQCSGKPIEKYVLSSGEEFHHVFTVDPKFEEVFFREFGSVVTKVGIVTEAERGCWMIYNADDPSQKVNLLHLDQGFSHFSS